MIGVEPARTAWGGSTREFAAALRAKTGRYELAGRPYVIALGNTHMFQSADDPLDVLYGQVAIEIIGGPNRDWRRARYESRTGCSAQTEIAASQPYYNPPALALDGRCRRARALGEPVRAQPGTDSSALGCRDHSGWPRRQTPDGRATGA